MKQIWYVNGVKSLGRQATLFGDTEEIPADHIIMLKECFWGRGLSIKDVRKLAFDLAENINSFTYSIKRKCWSESN
jgi:hypothetical protein